jgi:hypothetical protein
MPIYGPKPSGPCPCTQQQQVIRFQPETGGRGGKWRRVGFGTSAGEGEVPAASRSMGRVPPTVVEAGAPPGRDEEKMAALVAAQEVGREPPAQDKETMVALVATQEAGRVPPTAVEAGAPPGQDEETMAAL